MWRRLRLGRMVDPGDSSVRGGVRRGSSGKAEAGEVEKPAGGGESVNWFPGHMVRALKDIRSKMKVVDIVVDVRDARVPFSSRAPGLVDVARGKRRLVVLNKSDLCNPHLMRRVEAQIREDEGAPAIHVHSIGTRMGPGFAALIEAIRNTAMTDPQRPNPSPVSESSSNEPVRRLDPGKPLVLMIVGLPNTGKSSVVNQLRHHAPAARASVMRGVTVEAAREATPAAAVALKVVRRTAAARVGAIPGITRRVATYRLLDAPPVVLLDTPGVFMPARDVLPEAAKKLALVGLLPAARVELDQLYAFLQSIRGGGLKETKTAETDEERKKELKKFQAGELGRMTLDQVK